MTPPGRIRFLSVMAWRETRGALRHFIFFLVCIALGVGSLVGVSGFSSALDQAVRREARTLMAADVQVRAGRPLSERGLATLRSLEGRGIQTAVVNEMVAMAVNPLSGQTLLVELKAAGPGYPFYGELMVSPPEAASALTDPSKALVEEGLMIRLGLQPGDRITVGRAELTVAGLLTREPDRVVGAFSLGPRLLIGQAALEKTKLIQPGSRVRYRYLLKLPPDHPPAALVKELERALSADRAAVNAYDDAQPRLQRFLRNLTTYLGLAGMIALLLGGIGVANSVRAFMNEKMDTLAILKGLGAGSSTLLRVYLLQTLLLSGVGSLIGAALGMLVQWLLPSMLSSLLPVELGYDVTWLPMLRGVAMGMLTALLFALWPLLGIRRLSPARLLRRDVDAEARFQPGGGRPWIAAIVIVSGLAALSLWQIGRVGLGLTFLGVLAASALLLWAGAWATVWSARRLPKPRALALRQGLANLHRPGSPAVVAMLSVGIGVTVILAIALIEANLLRHVDENLPTEAPSFYFIDVQSDQGAPLMAFFEKRGLSGELTPIVRSRLHAVGDRTVADMSASGGLQGRQDAWYFQREYVVTMQAALPKGNRLIEGAWWDGGARGAGPLISVEREAAQHLGIGLGSALTFDMQGRLVTATVASLREVNWGSFGTNFYVIFSPGALDGLPLTYIATARTAPSDDLLLQRDVVAAFPNVTAINVRHVLDAVGAVLERIAQVVRFMAAFTVGTGLLVLAGAIATTRYRRVREAVILKTLGATRMVIARIFAVEYAVLGAVAGVIGAATACLLSYVLLRYFLELPWRWEPGTIAAGLFGAVLLTVLTGFLSTARLLGRKPLAVLRQE